MENLTTVTNRNEAFASFSELPQALQNIVSAAIAQYGCTYDEMRSPSRKRELADARCMIVKLSNEQLPEATQELIGDLINRERSNIPGILMRFDDLYSTDKQFRVNYELIKIKTEAA